MAETRAPATIEELRAEIVRRHGDLSKRLQQIGRHILDDPNDFALETLAVIASRCGVQPSAIVRFAKSFGFEGASQMQKLFRDGLISAHAALGYSERVRQLDEATARGAEPGELLAEFVEGNVLALNNLLQMVSSADLEAAVAAIVDAAAVHVVGFRRSFPVASYLAYSLLQAEKRTLFIDGVGGLARQQVQAVSRGDLLIAVSFQPYAEETVAIVEEARARGATVLAISDSLVSPIAKPPRSCCRSANRRCASSARCPHRCASRRRWSSTTRSPRAGGNVHETHVALILTVEYAFHHYAGAVAHGD